MHGKVADIATVAKRSGQKNFETIKEGRAHSYILTGIPALLMMGVIIAYYFLYTHLKD